MTKKDIFERNKLLLIDRMEYVLNEIKSGNLVDADMFFEQKKMVTLIKIMFLK